MNFGIPGWEAELHFDEDCDNDRYTVKLVARRTAEGPWTEADQWMFEHGQAYLNETLKRVHGRFNYDLPQEPVVWERHVNPWQWDVLDRYFGEEKAARIDAWLANYARKESADEPV